MLGRNGQLTHSLAILAIRHITDSLRQCNSTSAYTLIAPYVPVAAQNALNGQKVGRTMGYVTKLDNEVTEILYGRPVPVTRKVVEFGQPCLNGDIVTLPDMTGNSDMDDKCYFCNLVWHECIKTDCQDKRRELLESMSEYHDHRRNHCNCESAACMDKHPMSGCNVTVTAKSPLMRYVGHICEACANRISDSWDGAKYIIS